MGFGFNLLFAFILMPFSIILFITWAFTKSKLAMKILKSIWITIGLLVLLVIISAPFVEKIELNKQDFYGEYIIDRDFFKGEQTNWQYNRYRFEITEDDSIFFHVTDKDRIIKTYKGIISTVKPYNSHRLILDMDQPTHHIMSGNPTIYREIWGFYMEFHSPKFRNVFFRKGEWKEIGA
ncbi:hypothetical protein V6R21_08900 [Limibacter armeniacum]|uniref:hypothetical protein n=1 Tax=Limibacter armeniacum TaxID=466084 RepID=UPI002FE57737